MNRKYLTYLAYLGLVTLLVGLALLLMPAKAHAAVFITTYETNDYLVERTTFDAQYHVVYLKATGLQKNKPYHSQWYDDSNALVASQGGTSDNSGIFLSLLDLSPYTASTPGIWRIDLINDQNGQTVGTAAITVDPSAIPEFPAVIAGIVVVGICAGIYWRSRGCKTCRLERTRQFRLRVGGTI